MKKVDISMLRGRVKNMYVYLFVVTSLILFGCGTTSPNIDTESQTPRGDEKATLSEEQRISVSHEFFVRGRHQDLKGNEKLAMEYYTFALDYDSLNRELCFFLSRKYKAQGDMEKARDYGLKGLHLPGKSRFSDYMEMGEVFLRLGKLSQATSYYEKAMAIEEENHEILYTLGTIYEQTGDVAKQVDVLAKLIPLVNYPERIVSKIATIYKSQGKLQKLEELYQHAWKETNHHLYGERLAGVYESLGLYNHFLDTYRELQTKDPENIYYKVQIARTFISLGLTDSAFQYYEELVKDFPEKEQFLFTYTTLLFEKGKYEEARINLLQLLEQQPENATYHYYLGSVAEMMEDEELAELEYKKAVSLNKEILEYWAKLGLFYLKQERHQRATELFANMVSTHDKSAYAWYLCGVAYNRIAEYWERKKETPEYSKADISKKGLGFRDLAVERFRYALTLNDQDSRVLFELGVSLERSSKAKEAIEVFKQLVEIDSSDANALNYLGYLMVENMQEMKKAAAYIDQALRIEPENGAFLDSKGWWFYQMKKYELAKEYIERSLATGVNDIVIIEHLALILEKLGDTESAKEQWTLILKMDPNHKLANSRLN
jgi:tetratricopeptide (TPR) repeat protein